MRGSNGGTTPLPEGKNWLPHTGRRQIMRELSRSWRWFEKKCAKSDTYSAARDDLIDCIARNVGPASFPEDELATLFTVHAARVKSNDTARPFLDVLATAMRELDAQPRVSDAWNAS